MSSLDSDVFFEFLGSYGTKILMDDYYTFLKERKINTEGRFREDYWKNDWDRYWTDYCTEFNTYVLLSDSVSQEVHYFRNNLNRIPKDLDSLKANEKNWVLLAVGSSSYHMRPSTFSGNGLYNLKFISSDGRNEAVYVGKLGANNTNINKGRACTEKTDPENMGTYNFDGMYYKTPPNSIGRARHGIFDVLPYDHWGNISKDDLPGDGEKFSDNEKRYNYDKDAIKARQEFINNWKGIKE